MSKTQKILNRDNSEIQRVLAGEQNLLAVLANIKDPAFVKSPGAYQLSVESGYLCKKLAKCKLEQKTVVEDVPFKPGSTLTLSDDTNPNSKQLNVEVKSISIKKLRDFTEEDAKALNLKPDYCDHARMSCEEIGCLGKWVGALEIYINKYYGHEDSRADDWVWLINI